eukprot:symbB.v1.2.023807.t1/scaffold2161.1/size87477/5
MLCLAYGRTSEGQMVGEEREKAWHTTSGNKQFPGSNPPVVTCLKGNVGLLPNQDNFSIAYLKNGWTIACCADGHGVQGHLVSSRIVQTLQCGFQGGHRQDCLRSTYLYCQETKFPTAIEAAFDFAEKDLLAHASKSGWECEASGASVVLAVYKGGTIYTAHCGDCRCVIGLAHSGELAFATQDHKPDVLQEQARIQASGGEVRSEIYPDGWVVHRVFAHGEDFPGLCKSRTVGDLIAKDYGVIAVPDVATTEVKLGRKPFMLLASDGIWEFLDSEFILSAEGPTRTAQKLQREARKRWKQEEGSSCDDTTAILIQLG